MWRAARATDAFAAAVAGATTYRIEIVRLFGIPESEIASTLRAAADAGLDLDQLEITTCLRRGEIEVATRFEPPAEPAYEALLEFLAARHERELFSRDGSTVDQQVAELLRAGGHTLAVAESCTGGGFASRLTDRAGSSAYFLGGAVVYSNQAKVDLAGVDPDLLERHGAVSYEVAEALASGIATRFGADIGVAITGIAGPDGGTPEKPVGLVYISIYGLGGPSITRETHMPGGRGDVRDRSITVAMHLLRRLLLRGRDLGSRGAGEGFELDARSRAETS
jgi:nicotinamide-nucleotide amidase